MKIIENKVYDEERSLYASNNVKLINILFSGPKDGESALKEAKNVIVQDCKFCLRYPFWHNENVEINKSEMTETCRAALWYSSKIKINECDFQGVKVLRECSNINVEKSNIISTEPFWYCKEISILGGYLNGEYAFLNSENIVVEKLSFKGKYSFQYVKNVVIKDSYLDTKDAFWEAENVTVINSVVKGEYLGWYSKNLKLVNCKIIGTQPLCYCEGLVLENCEMEKCDLSFEYSDVSAKIQGTIDSVKNPKTGYIYADNIDDVILDENILPGSNCEIVIGK